MDKGYLWRQILSYLLIIFKSFFITKRLPEVDLVYLDSDGVWDIIPSLFYKKVFPECKLISMNHHMISIRYDSVYFFFSSLVNKILQKIGYFLIIKFSDAVFILDTAMGEKIKLFLCRKGYSKKCYYVKNGVDIYSIEQISEQTKQFEACFFGALRPSKGLTDIVPIWKLVCNQNRGAKLIIVGGMLPRYKKYLCRMIKNNKLKDNIFLFDYIPNKKEAVKLIKKCKIFICPSHEEGWGIAIMECLASGLPGVVWDLPTYKRILKEEVIKIKPNNIGYFADQIVRLLNDDKVFNRLKDRTIDSVKQFNWDIVAREDMKIFQEITSV